MDGRLTKVVYSGSISTVSATETTRMFIQGPDKPTSSGRVVLSMIAGETLSGHRIVRIGTDDHVVHASSSAILYFANPSEV